MTRRNTLVHTQAPATPDQLVALASRARALGVALPWCESPADAGGKLVAFGKAGVTPADREAARAASWAGREGDPSPSWLHTMGVPHALLRAGVNRGIVSEALSAPTPARFARVLGIDAPATPAAVAARVPEAQPSASTVAPAPVAAQEPDAFAQAKAAIRFGMSAEAVVARLRADRAKAAEERFAAFMAAEEAASAAFEASLVAAGLVPAVEAEVVEAEVIADAEA